MITRWFFICLVTLKCAATLVVLFVLRETTSSFFDSEEEENRQPRIRWNDVDHGNLVKIIQCWDFDLLIEGKITGNSKDFLRAFSVTLTAHYVFNVTYAPNIASTMIVLQKLILGHNDGMKPLSKVLQLITKFKKLISWLKQHYSSAPNCRSGWNSQFLGRNSKNELNSSPSPLLPLHFKKFW